jgi:tetratricopeptide (TPR) repeat protein
MSINKSQPEFHFSLALCYIEMERIKEAVNHFSHFIKARPKNVKGWRELIKCLYEAEYYEEAMEQISNAQKYTDNKPLFIFYKSAVLFELGKSKEALLQLEMAMKQAPSLVRQFIELKPSLLQHPAIVEIIGTYKKPQKRKKK